MNGAKEEKAESLAFWNMAAENYDEYVLGLSSPTEIRELEICEDKFFDLVLREHINSQKKTIFIEVGSGTGRYLLRCLNKIFTQKNYQQFLLYIVGVDFSIGMIEKSIQNITDYLPKLAKIADIDIQKAKRKLSERLLLVNADATGPFLSLEGDALSIVGMMFGTLGNIHEENIEAVLSRIRSLVDHGGEGIVTVFNKKEANIGRATYNEMQQLVGTDLCYNEDTGTFRTSDKGFYSHWFEEASFKELLARNRFDVIEERKIAKRGIGARFSTTVGKKRLFRAYKTHPALFLLCPICSNKLLQLPVTSWRISCPNCFSKFPVREINGFKVPVLLAEED